jgi:phosphatidylcholine synthase
LTFLPVRFVHPLRVKQWRWLNVMLLALWALLALVTVVAGLQPGPIVTLPLCAIALYFFVAGLIARPA